MTLNPRVCPFRAVHSNGPVWDDIVLADPEVIAAIANNGVVRREFELTNVDRSALGRIAGAIAKQHGAMNYCSSCEYGNNSGGEGEGGELIAV